MTERPFAETAGRSIQLFNGVDLDGWRQAGPDGFRIDNGMLVTEGGLKRRTGDHQLQGESFDARSYRTAEPFTQGPGFFPQHHRHAVLKTTVVHPPGQSSNGRR